MSLKRSAHSTPAGSRLQTFFWSAMTLPALVLALAMPSACATANSRFRSNAQSHSQSQSQSQSQHEAELDSKDAIYSEGFYSSVLREQLDPTLREALAQACKECEDLLVTNLEDAAKTVYLVGGAHGWGSGTAIACIPILVSADQVKDSQTTNPDGTPYKPWTWDDEEEKNSKAAKKEKVHIEYLVFVVTARHVTEYQETIILPDPDQDSAPGPDGPENPESPKKEDSKTSKKIIITRTEDSLYSRNDYHYLGFSKKISYTDDDVFSELDLREDAALLTFVVSTPVETMDINTEYTHVGDKVFKAGFGGGNQSFWYGQGLVADPDGRASAPIIFGDSGGALIDANISLVGVNVAVEVINFQGTPVVLTNHGIFVPVAKLAPWLVVSIVDSVKEQLLPFIDHLGDLVLDQ